ncbi:translation initiation factor eIF3 subunit [Serendipita sp. 400]|nr:translation initiation factor eIF3 subunit [Serendipita sp. 400]
MRPILLQGHERSLTQIKYNADGDLIFSCSKDHRINVWYSHNGERLGTYDGHNGTIWTVDVDSETKYLVSGAADNTLKLWDVRTGKCLHTWEFPTAVKRVAFSDDDNLIACITEQRMGYQGAVRVFRINRNGTEQSEEPLSIFHPIESKATVLTFGLTPDTIITGHESGKLTLYNTKNGEELATNKRAHREILLGGGQEAMSVTTTSLRQGKFETRFWHKIFEEEVGRVKGHFGPINTIAVHPAGTSYASGGEDGFIRVHHFDESYFKARPYGDLEPEDD